MSQQKFFFLFFCLIIGLCIYMMFLPTIPHKPNPQSGYEYMMMDANHNY